MNTGDRLARLLGPPELRWLVQRVRRRAERGQPLHGTVTLSGASPAQREAVDRLLGRRTRPGATVSVRLDDVDEILRRSGVRPAGLLSAVESLTGPLRDLAADAATSEAAWRAAFAPLDDAAARRPALLPWLDGLRATGTVRRLAPDPDDARDLLVDCAAALHALPREPESMGRFAERVLGSAHGLDDGRPVTGLLFGAARALGDTGDGEGAAWRREVWAAVGLLRDELSSTVLVLGLPGGDRTVTGRILDCAAGEPVVLTLRQLTRHAPELRLPDALVSVCENPVVVAEAADRLGPASRPLVCLGGHPGAAAMTLLRLVVGAGGRLRHHGDFDWGGLRIGNVLRARLPVTPWRYDTAAYHGALATGAGRPLAGSPTEASWDPGLGAAMRAAGRAVEEERVLDDLVDDLAGSDREEASTCS
ncbi:MAG: TIGR02679 family protein [Pseudonocardia sp.]|nr:TIGR02679 family protein [Pseudonocardia sp.]